MAGTHGKDEGRGKKGNAPKIVSARIIVHQDGTVDYEGDSAAIAEAVEHDVRARARQERRKKAWGKIGPDAMTRLAGLFPSL